MTIEKSVLVPLGIDETFALLTEPARLRRWQAVAARIDVARRRRLPLDDHAGPHRGGKGGRGRAGTQARAVVGLGGRRLGVPSDFHRDRDPRACRRGHGRPARTRGARPRSRRPATPKAGPTTSGASSWRRRRGTPGPTSGPAAPDPMDRLTAAEASLAVCQLVLRQLSADDGSRPPPAASSRSTNWSTTWRSRSPGWVRPPGPVVPSPSPGVPRTGSPPPPSGRSRPGGVGASTATSTWEGSPCPPPWRPTSWRSSC